MWDFMENSLLFQGFRVNTKGEKDEKWKKMEPGKAHASNDGLKEMDF
jgi:hypothetical protein